VETRAHREFSTGAIPGSLNIPAGGSFVTWASCVIDPEQDGKPIVLLARDEADARALRDKLTRVGISHDVVYTHNLEGPGKARVSTVSPDELEDLEEIEDFFNLDVRVKGEYEAGHIPGATQLHNGRLMCRLKEVPRDRTIVMHCQTGTRSGVVASSLRAAGFDNVVELEGSYEGWVNAQERMVKA
jgi:hydroxyacylglutathione hydrolase